MNRATVPSDSCTNHENKELLHKKKSECNGFCEPAPSYSAADINLNELLMPDKNTCYLFRMNSDSMINAGIAKGDILIVDQSLTADNEKIIVVMINGKLVVRRYRQTIDQLILVAENGRYANTIADQSINWLCLGVVTSVIRMLENSAK